MRPMVFISVLASVITAKADARFILGILKSSDASLR